MPRMDEYFIRRISDLRWGRCVHCPLMGKLRPLWSAAAMPPLSSSRAVAWRPHSRLRSKLQPISQRTRQTGFDDRRLRLHVVVRNAKELNRHQAGVENRERRFGISIARLTDGAGIDE